MVRKATRGEAKEPQDVIVEATSGPERLTPALGERPTIDPSSKVMACALGPWTEIGPRSTVIETDFGAYSYVGGDSQIVYATIGRFCSIASHTRINPGNHPTWRASQHHFTYRASAYGLGDDEPEFFSWRREDRVAIGHDVWIGHGAIILAGRTIGSGAVVGAGSVVTRDVAPYTLVAGNPAGPIRRRFPPELAARLEALAWWDWPHERIREALADFRTLSVEAFLDRHEAKR